ncbi:unnamed protein product [Ambrosiozyma monospora]|uniref:Unnamed protein product n=1 Tax=Ambrosiozyma monospora TaxID=43982 RepID=A0ACB5TBU2_AMBMO|nr:unnamed protein product [Ambrosiozyma monospora]
MRDTRIPPGTYTKSFQYSGSQDNTYHEATEDLNTPSSAEISSRHSSFRLPNTAIASENSDKLTSAMQDSQVYFGTCREIQESQGKHTSMILAITYKTSITYLGNLFDYSFNINYDNEVMLKILVLFHIGLWLKNHRYSDDELKRNKLNELRANVKNEIAIYIFGDIITVFQMRILIIISMSLNSFIMVKFRVVFKVLTLLLVHHKLIKN